jgi:hypothetical protein
MEWRGDKERRREGERVKRSEERQRESGREEGVSALTQACSLARSRSLSQSLTASLSLSLSLSHALIAIIVRLRDQSHVSRSHAGTASGQREDWARDRSLTARERARGEGRELDREA